MNNLTIDVATLETYRAGANCPFILDVRNPSEFREANIDGHLIPLNELPDRLHELPAKNEMIIVHCQHGIRSMQAVQFLRSQGYVNAMSLEGGLAAFLKKQI